MGRACHTKSTTSRPCCLKPATSRPCRAWALLANSDLVVQIVLQVDLVGDDSHSQARSCLRGKETARGAVLDEEEIEGRRREGGIWRPAVTPWAPCVVLWEMLRRFEAVPLSPRRSTVVLRHRGPLKTLVVTICIHT